MNGHDNEQRVQSRVQGGPLICIFSTAFLNGISDLRDGVKSRAVGLVLITALAFAGLLSQTSQAQAQSYRFNSVEVQGNQRVDPATIVTYAGIGKGETVSAARLNDAYQNIVGSGLFESVELVPQGSKLVVVVQEFPTINVISFEGNARVKDEQLSEIVRSQSRRVYSPSVAEADAAAIAESYSLGGRLAATVTPKIIRRSDNRVDLVFEIQEGRVVEVERISFVGNRSYGESRLRRVLGTKQAGIFRQLVRSDTLIADRIEFDKQLLRDFYQSRGYVDFQVLSATPELTRDRGGFLITFNLREGQQFRIGRVGVASELSEVDSNAYAKALKLRPGVVYSPTLVENDIARLERLAVKQGLNFIRVEPRITRNDRAQTLDLDFVLTRGPRIFVERIDIEGNTTTLDRVIRRQFDTVEGDPFNPREVRETAERIRALGFFEDAQVNARAGTAPDQVIVDVDVVEAPTGSLGFGANYSTDDGFGISVTFAERNFLGRGQSLSLNFDTNSSTGSYGFNFVEPAFLDRDVVFALQGQYRVSEDDNSRYSTKRVSLKPSFSFPISEASRFGVSFNVGNSKVYGIDRGFPDDSDDPDDTGSSNILRLEEDQGTLNFFELGYNYNYNSRRIGLDPTSAVAFNWSQDFGVRDDTNYIRSTFLLRGRKAVYNEGITLRAELEGGAVNYSGGQSRIIDRFTLNGRIRGFESNGLGPRDLEVTNEDSLGGNMFLVARLEADFPLGLPEEYGITGGLFYDIGSVWSLDNINGGPDGNDPVDDSMRLRSAIGIGINWTTPIGPLRFNFSKALQKEDYDEEQNFELTIQTTF